MDIEWNFSRIVGGLLVLFVVFAALGKMTTLFPAPLSSGELQTLIGAAVTLIIAGGRLAQSVEDNE